MTCIQDNSVDLIITSPPYPMIEMWDSLFIRLNPSIGTALASHDPVSVFEAMHCELDPVWKECWRVLKNGGFICINIGDAVRTIRNMFQHFPNHSRIISAMQRIGFIQVPDILWRKQTNAPTKFMGSGMLPAGAYVTYEHEYILIFRKGDKREFLTKEAKANRRASAYFWEERNVWFSDVWLDIKGVSQNMKDDSTRMRSGAFPFELAYRLLCMYSVYHDLILDPFAGSGTTTAAAITGCRNSISLEMDNQLMPIIKETIESAVQNGKQRIIQRLRDHQTFIAKKRETGRMIKHYHSTYQVEVITSQETDIAFYFPVCISEPSPGTFITSYQPFSKE